MKTVSIETLRGDLNCAWITTQEQRDNGEWIFGIDPESMNTLNLLLSKSHKSYTLSSLALDIMKGHTIMPQNTQDKVILLSEALERANKAALLADDNSDGEDKGSCNFDSAVIRLPRWKDYEVRQAAELAAITLGEPLSGYWKGYRFVNTSMYGQANRRTRMAEAAKKSLANDGYDVCMYYQMD